MGRDWVLSPEVALLAEGVDRNTIATSKTGCVQASPSSRRAWIEITVFSPLRIFSHVALLAEGVDRNRKPARLLYGLTPSPSSRRAWIEISQIRRSAPHTSSPSSRRAWIEIQKGTVPHRNGHRSPSSRRAWIEIDDRVRHHRRTGVALLAEGVDRNKAV